MSSQANDLTRGAAETAQARIMRAQRLLAAGGLLGALAASSCCVVPLALFTPMVIVIGLHLLALVFICVGGVLSQR